MATLIKGLLAHNLDWQFVLVGVFLSITIQLCGVSALSFAVGAYLPLSTTFPIFIGGMIRGFVDRKKGGAPSHDDDLGPGSLFSTGLVAGGALAGVLVAFLVAGADKLKEQGNTSLQHLLDGVNFHDQMHHALGGEAYALLGVACFVGMGTVLYKVALKPTRA
jgi:hypothetical protein